MEKPDIIAPPDFQKTMIWLHGLGDTSAGEYNIFKTLALPGWRIILPTAPVIKITAFNEEERNSWFNYVQYPEDEMRDDMIESARYVCKLIDEFQASVIGGISQGGIIALLTAFNVSEQPLDGVIALSSRAAPFEKKRNVQSFIYHGDADPVIPLERAKETYSRVLGIDEIWVEPGLAHCISDIELQEMQKWLSQF